MRHTAMRGFPVIAFLGAAATLVVALLFVVALPVAASDDPPDVSYTTVVVAAVTSDDGNPATSFRVTWNDTHDCLEGYNAYVHDIESYEHLGTGATEISNVIENSDLRNGLGYWVYAVCGEMYIGRHLPVVGVPEGVRSSALMPGTYTSEPALTSLSLDVGNFDHSFHKNRFAYVVQDVPDETEQVTVTASARAGNAIKFVDGHGERYIDDCDGWSCQYQYRDGNGNELQVLQDADDDVPGFQINLKENGASFLIHVHPFGWGHTYEVTVVRATPNSPATNLAAISGTAQVGETLTADTSDIADEDGLDNVAFSYQWLADQTDIQGATGFTYTLVADDKGKTIKVRVTFTDDAGNEEALTSAPTAVVSAALPPPPDNVRAVTQESGAVELTWDAPDGTTVTGYGIERRLAGEDRSDQQRSDGSPGDQHTLVEDTGSADTDYTDNSAERGVEYEYQVSARNEAGPGEASGWVRADPATASNTPATGAPTIRGTAQVGETLTANISGIADADGLSGETFTYQWVSSDGTTDTDIEDATGSTYKLVASDQGKAIKVRVSFTDDGGNEESLTSAPTEPVFGDGPPGAPRNLTVTAGDQEVTLSWEPPADNGNAPATRYRIEWRIDGKDYKKGHWGPSGETTYTKTDLANGVKYIFRVKAENGNGNSYGPYGPASEEVSATPTSGLAVDLGTPVLSNTKTLHHGMVKLDWEDVEDAGWYVVQYYHVKGGEWLDLPAAGVDIAFHGSSAVVSNLHGLSWLRVRAMSCAGESEWSQIEELYGTNASDWEGVPVPEVAEGDEIEPCPVVLGTPVLSNTETLHHGMVRLDWEDIEDAGWYVVQYYHVKGGEWLDLPAEGVDIAFHGSSAVVSNLHGLSWLRVGAASCDGASEWSQIEELYGTNASDWEGVPVPDVEEGDEIEPCSEDGDTPDNSPATGAPAISGTAQVGETLTANSSGVADADGLSNVQYEYQWLADDSDISGATNATYTLVAEDEGKAIKVKVSFTDDAGNEETLTSEPTAVVAAAPPPPPDNVRAVAKKSGAVELTWDAPQDATVIGYRIERRPTGGNPSDQQRSAGSPRDHHTLVEDTGSADTGYTDNTAQKGVGYEYRVSARNEAGAGEESDWVNAEEATASNSTATGAPTISGTAQVGETLTADTSGIADADGLANATFSYQWLADDTDIAGATGLTYTLTDSEESKAITVRVSFTDDADNEETLTSAATAAVAAKPNSPATGEPGLSFSWMTRVGETITADTSGIADADGLTNATFSYQWLADDVEIAGATGLTYTLVAADEGKAISVRVGFTDDAGHEETLTSWATGAVVAANVGLVVNTVIAEPVREGSYARVSFSVTRFTVGKKYSFSFGAVWIADNSAFFFVEPMSICVARGLSFPMDILVDSSDTVITHEGLISDRCPAGDYKLVVSWRTEDGEEEGRHLTSFQVLEDDTEVDEYSSQYVDYITPEYPDPPAEHGPFFIGLLSTAGPEWGSVIYDWGIAGVVPDSDPDTLDYVVSLRVVDDDNNPVANCNEDGVGGSYKLYTIPEDRGWGREVTLSARCMSGAGSATFTIEFLNGSSELLLRAESPLGAARPNGDEADTPDGDDENAPSGVVINTVIAEPVQEGVGANVSVSVTGFTVGESYELSFGKVIPANVCSVNSFDPIPVDLAGYGWIIHVDSSDYVWTKEGFISPTCPAGTYSWEVNYRRLNSFEIGMSASLFTVVAALPNSPATGTPTISGTAQVGETLTANTSGVIDADGLSSVQYEHQWLADDTEIAGATNATYTLVAQDEGKAIKVQVSFTDDEGNAETLTSAATAVVAAALPPPPDNVRAVAKKSGAVELTWDAPQDATVTGYRIERRPTGGSPSDQQRSAGSPRDHHTLVEDTGSADTGYTDNTAEKGVGYEYRVSARNEAGAGEESDWVNAEEATVSNSTATGAPTISGTAQVGETLTADTSGIADADGLANATFSYQWLADDTDIAGATGLTYTLTDSEESKAITVRVSFTDAADNEETLTSAATAAVAGAQPTEPPDKPTGLEATATHDSVTLTWDDPGDDTITGYVILRRIPGVDSEGHFDVLVADTGTAATTYTDNTVAAETRYTYRIKAINGAGTSERSRWSHIDTPAAPVPDKPTGLEATESDGQVVLTWDDPGDDSITGYVILRRVRENNTGGDFSVLVADTGTAALTYTDDTVAAGLTYTYRIKAINEHGTSERSRWFHIDIPAAP